MTRAKLPQFCRGPSLICVDSVAAPRLPHPPPRCGLLVPRSLSALLPSLRFVRRGGARIVLALAKTSGFHLSGRSEGLLEDDVEKLADEPLLGSGECGQNGMGGLRKCQNDII